MSDYRLRQIGLEEFAKVKRENAKSLLAETHPASKLVSKVGLRIATAAGVPQHELATWQFLVIRNDQPNAFVLPGGFVCVYTGLFRVAPTEVTNIWPLFFTPSILCLSSSLSLFPGSFGMCFGS